MTLLLMKPQDTPKSGELTEDEVNKLNDDLNRLLDMLDERPEIRVTYFVPDKRKSGGSYQTKTGIVRIYDSYTNELVFMDKTRIAVEDMCLVEFVEERGKYSRINLICRNVFAFFFVKMRNKKRMAV